MEIVRTVTRDQDLLPPAMEAIRRVPDNFWTHTEQRVLHPRTVYSRALNKVTEVWADVFNELDALSAQLRFDQPATAAKTLEAKYGSLLHALTEHIEACYAVMRCLAKPPDARGLWHHKVAKKQNLPGLKAFEEQVITGYRAVRLGEVVNLLKHDEARLRVLAMRSGLAFTLAYFVDGPQPSGAIGPSLRVHPDGNSAFSFNRDMLLHWWWLYRSSQLLAKVVEQATTQPERTSRSSAGTSGAVSSDGVGPPVKPTQTTPAAFELLCRRVADIRADFMIDETHQPFPLVLLNKAANSMRIAFPAGRRPNSIIGEVKFTQLITVDEAGQAYKMPYMGRNADEVTVEAT